jgi:hypothetical protein
MVHHAVARRVKRRTITIVVALFACLSIGSTAGADYFSAPYADNSAHSVWYSYSNLGSARYNGVHYARIYSVEPTDMTTTKAAQYSSSTDVAVMMAAGTGQQQNWYAWTTCVTGGPNCDQFTVTFSSINPHTTGPSGATSSGTPLACAMVRPQPMAQTPLRPRLSAVACVATPTTAITPHTTRGMSMGAISR